MRYFFSTGEASAETSAVLLAGAIAARDPAAAFVGIGSERMRAAGFTVRTDTRGWSGMGPLEALAKIPKLYAVMWRTAFFLARAKFDLVVLVDFGAFHLRLAKSLRMLGYDKPVLYFFPPGAWLDNPKQARAVAQLTAPLVAFAHQRDFYRDLNLPVHFFGHPLAPAYALRPPRPAPPRDGGTIALLPGSREGELRLHVPRLLDALALLRESRPALRVTAGAADAQAQALIERALAERGLRDVRVVRSAAAALQDADAAWIASGTAVLEAALTGVPSVALYVLSPAQARIAKRVYHGTYVTIPNLVLDKAVVPELLQDDATPERLAQALDAVLCDPHAQYAQLTELRSALGAPDALDRCAEFAVALAGAR